MAAGVPIVTTSFRYHAPEFDYLADGVTTVVSDEDVDSYAAALVALLNNRQRQKEMSNRCRIEAEKYTLDSMVFSFLAGVKSALG